MSGIQVEATIEGLAERYQLHEVVIDGQRCGTLKGGETRVFDVRPGVHTLKLAMDSYTSPPVKVVVGYGKTRVLCQTTVRRWFGVFASLPDTQIIVREEPELALPAGPEIVWREPEAAAPSRLELAFAD
jgi:hypothetical protein